MKSKFPEYFKLFRIRHMVKNLFVFSPVFFGLKIDELSYGLEAVKAFILFSLVASSVYIINDVFDRESDRLHPEKKKRPIASGMIKVNVAWLFAFLFFSAGILIGFLINLKLAGVILLYFIMNLVYSIKLKHVPLLDIFIIAVGFILRIVAGSVMTGIMVSDWLIIMTFLVSVFLVLGKRRDDVIYSIEGKQVRKAVDGYNLEFINMSMSMVGGILILAYILYTISDPVTAHFNTSYLYLTVFLVILGVLRYLQLIFVFGRLSDPIELFYQDRFLQLVLVCWLAVFFILVYLR